MAHRCLQTRRRRPIGGDAMMQLSGKAHPRATAPSRPLTAEAATRASVQERRQGAICHNPFTTSSISSSALLERSDRVATSAIFSDRSARIDSPNG